MTDTTWKAAERRISQLLGGKRLGPTGTPQPDVVSDFLVAEVKHKKRMPQWLWDAVEQAREQRDVQRMPIVVLHQYGQRYDHSLVVARLDDFVHYVKGAGDTE